MIRRICCIILILTICQRVSSKIKIGSLVKQCSRSDPHLNECAKKAVNDILPMLAKGIRDYDLVPIEPMMIPFIEMTQSESPVGLKLNITNSLNIGMTQGKVRSIRIDPKKHHWEVDFLMPRFEMVGTCDVGGRILLLPVTGHGACNLTSVSHDLAIIFDGKIVNRTDNEYFKFQSFKTKLKFRKGYFKLEGLFGGNRQLGETMNHFLNSNALDVLNEMKPTLEKTWAKILKSIIQKIFDHVPYNEVLLP